jgi:filamentous hemagglutinin family protein
MKTKKNRASRRLVLPYRRIFPRVTAAAFACSLCMWMPTPVQAGDIEGANVISGQATVNQVAPNITNITASDRAIIEYQRFNIANQATVNFIQPSASAAVLNRIIGNSPSTLNGTLNANGQVYFVNPAGVYFGPNSVINASRFYAAAGNITNEDFSSGINRFTATGNITNDGSIATENGVYLIGQQSVNNGTIVAANGLVSLSSGTTEYIADGDSRVLVKVDSLNTAGAGRAAEGDSTGTGVANNGTIDGDEVIFSSGDIYSLAVTNTGTVTATGNVTLASSGDVENTGTIEAGGNVAISGDTATLIGGSIRGEENVTVYANHLMADSDISAGQEVVLDPTTLTVVDTIDGTDQITAQTVVDGVNTTPIFNLSADEIITVKVAIDTSAQANSNTLNFQDTGGAAGLTIDLQALITLGATQSLTGDGTSVNVNHTTNGGIQNGIDVAATDGTVTLAPGTYNITSTIQLNKTGVTLAGPQQGVDPRTAVVVVDGNGVATESTVTTTRSATDASTEAIIDGNGLGRLIDITGANTTVDGLVFTNSGGDMVYSPSATDNITVQYNIIHDSGDEGVQFKGATNSTIQNNYIFLTDGDGVNVSSSSSNNTIQYNQIEQISSPDAGIYTYGSSQDNTIQYNVVSDVYLNEGIKVGIKGSGADKALSGGSIKYNVVKNTGALATNGGGDGIAVYMSKTLVQGNSVYNAYGDHGAVYVTFAVDNVTIDNNYLHDSTRGIQIGATSLHPTHITITNNTIQDNGAGILYYGADAPVVTGNTLLGNGTHYSDPTGLSNYDTVASNNIFDQGGYIEGTTPSGAFTIGGEDIKALIESAAADDIVHIFSGNYITSTLIDVNNANVHILGPNAGIAPDPANRVTEAVIDGGIRVNASGFVLDGMKLINGLSISPDITTLHLAAGAHDSIIQNNIFEGANVASSRGIINTNAAVNDITIQNNDISGWTSGIFLNTPGGTTNILNNNIHDNAGAGIGSDGVANANIANNFFANNGIEHIGAGTVGANFVVINNSFDLSPTENAIHNYGGTANGIDASSNYFGTTDSSAVAIAGTVDFSPMITVGTDTSTDYGFQPVSDNLTVHQLGSQATGLINEGITMVDAGGTVRVAPGTYDESFTVDKSLSLFGANADVNPVTNMAGRGEESIITGTVTLSADDVVFNGFEMTAFDRHGIYVGLTDLTENVTVSNNYIHDFTTASSDSAIQLSPGNSGTTGGTAILNNINIVNNLIDVPNTPGTNSYAIRFSGQGTHFFEYNNLKISGNEISSPASYGIASGDNPGNYTMELPLIDGNYIHDTITAINLGNMYGGVISNNTIENATQNAANLGVINGEITGNIFLNTTRTGETNDDQGHVLTLWGDEYGQNPSENVTITGNEFHYNTDADYDIIAIWLRHGPVVDTIHINENTFINHQARENVVPVANVASGPNEATIVSLDATNNTWYYLEGESTLDIPVADLLTALNQQVFAKNAGSTGFVINGPVEINPLTNAASGDNLGNTAAQNSNPNTGGTPGGGAGGGQGGGGNVTLALGDTNGLPLSMQLALNDNANGGGEVDPELAAQLDTLFANFLTDQLAQFQLALGQQYDSYIANASADLSMNAKMAGFYNVVQAQSQLNTQFKELLLMIESVEKLAESLGMSKDEARELLISKVKPASMSIAEFDALIQTYRTQQ